MYHVIHKDSGDFLVGGEDWLIYSEDLKRLEIGKFILYWDIDEDVVKQGKTVLVFCLGYIECIITPDAVIHFGDIAMRGQAFGRDGQVIKPAIC